MSRARIFGLIHTPKNRVDIELYRAIGHHLAAFRQKLQKRATRQNWWELQQAQAAYEASFIAGGLTFPDISQGPKFSIASAPSYIDCTAFRINYPWKRCTRRSWFKGVMVLSLFAIPKSIARRNLAFALENPICGVVEVNLDISAEMAMDMSVLGNSLSEMATQKSGIFKGYLHRVSDMCAGRSVPEKFAETLTGDFDNFRKSLKKLRVEIPVPSATNGNAISVLAGRR